MIHTLYQHPDGGAITFNADTLQIILTDAHDQQTALPIGWLGLANLGHELQELAKAFAASSKQ